MHAEQYRERLIQIILDLIENEGVTQFYSGYRGDFDIYCSFLIYELKDRYPNIRNTMALAYLPEATDGQNVFHLPECFDDSVYLLERQVPKRLALLISMWLGCADHRVDMLSHRVVWFTHL